MPIQAQVKSEFLIKKIDPNLFVSPKIPASGYAKQESGAARPGKWLEVDVNFEREKISEEAPKYSDDLTVNFYILLDNAAETIDKQPTFLTGSTTISDVPYGKGFHIAMFVAPQTLSRYFEGKFLPTTTQPPVINVGVTISNATGIVAAKSLKNGAFDKQGNYWWDNDAGITRVTGRVLEKGQTPFASVEWDYFVPSKPKAAN